MPGERPGFLFMAQINLTGITPILQYFVINKEDTLNRIPVYVYNYAGNLDLESFFINISDPDFTDITTGCSMCAHDKDLNGYYINFNETNIRTLNSTNGEMLNINCYIPTSNETSLNCNLSSSGYASLGIIFAIAIGSNNYAKLLKIYSMYGVSSDTAPFYPVDSKGSFNLTSILEQRSYLTNTDSPYQIAAQTLSEHLIDPEDPFNGADDSAPNGGGGNMDYTSDEDDFPALPTNTVADSGFVTLYAPTAAQLKSLADYLWSDTFSLDSFKKLFNNPMDCILGLSLVPVNLPHGAAKEITVGNLVSTVSCDTCTTQYVYVDCGSITVSPTSFTNSYLDFSPYTQMSIYLPYIGTEPLDVDECMDATIHVRYHIDVLTGAMCCFVKITNTNPISGSSATHVLYTYMGQCCESVPLSSDQWGNTIGAIMQAAAAIGGVVATAATGGAAAPAAAAQLTMATTATVNAATSMKPTVNHSGSLGGGGGMMAQRTPKLIMKAPNISKPASQQSYTGYPVNQTKKLSACSGFTQVQNINLSVSGATQAELNEIENLLVTGVII